MKLSIDRSDDNSGLEPGVVITKRYRGCHRNICDDVLTTAECVDVVRHLQPQRLAPTPPIRLNGASKVSAHGLDLRFTVRLLLLFTNTNG